MLSGAQEALGVEFVQLEYLLEAITHSSYSNEWSSKNGGKPRANNERLEFLGDAVIGLVVAELLMESYPQASEGCLSRWRSQLVSRKTLAEMALRRNLGRHLLLGKGEVQTEGFHKKSILAGLFESLAGAIYQDQGLGACRAFLAKEFKSLIDSLQGLEKKAAKLVDKKTLLQEFTQAKFSCAPQYEVVKTWGPEHEKVFRVRLTIDGKEIALGEGKSKKDAEQNAASLSLEILEF